jgi:hypothetical protein
LREVVGSGTSRLPPAPVPVSLVNEAQLKHELDKLGKVDQDPSGDKADHTLAVLAAVTDLIHHSSPKSDSEGNQRSLHGGAERGTPKEDCRRDPAGG